MKVSKSIPNPIDVSVGGRIRLRRRIIGMSQTSLAEALGITFQQVQKYERGTNRVGASRLQAVANALNVPVSHFFDGDAPTEQSTEVEDERAMSSFFATSEGIALNRAFVRITNANVRRKIVLLIKALAKGNVDPSV